MRARIFFVTAVCVFGCVALRAQARGSFQDHIAVTPITWADTAPLHTQLDARGLSASGFTSYIERVRQTNQQRVREGDLDHLVFYLLQSKRFTSQPSIEPALSAKALVEGLEPADRETFLRSGQLSTSHVPAPVRSRAAAFLHALGASASDPRLVYLGSLIDDAFSDSRERPDRLLREYLRVMRFVYEKEFIAQRSARAAEAVSDLYRSRGLSTDTAVEAGYVVHLGLGVVKSLDPDRRIRRVLIVGPGLDLAPRTGLLEDGPPESYQPWAVIDALLSLGLSRADDSVVVGADINPRVVDHLRGSSRRPPTLTLLSGIEQTNAVTLRPEYREYFTRLGRAIGEARAEASSSSAPANGHLRKTVRVGPAAARMLRAETLDIVTGRLDDQPFDLIVATNILPYFDDVQLMLALSNIAAMLAPGGVFLHNEARPALRDVTAALGLPAVQSRHAVIADVRGAPAPLFDSVFIHKKARR